MKNVVAGLMMLAGCWVCNGGTFYVATNGVDGHAGDSWANAVATISNAAALANKLAGSVILVSNGHYYITYVDTVYRGVTLSNGVSCRGFSGDPADVIVDGMGTSRCFYLTNASLAHITITNGKSANLSGDGGGIYCEPGIVSNCHIAGNVGRMGGGLRCFPGSTVADCLFTGNRAMNAAMTAGEGGGAWIWSSQFLRNVVRENFAAVAGGGVILHGSSMIADCVIAGNMATNTTTTYGGGIAHYSNSTGTIANCFFISNVVVTPSGVGGYGGACRVQSGVNVYSNCIFAYNVNASPNTSYGGAVYCGSAEFYNCAFYSNQTYAGGAAFMTTGSSRWRNCTISRNRAAGHGGGLYFAVVGEFVNCVVVGNQSSVSSNYYFEGVVKPYFTNCCAMPGLNAYGTNNIAVDPNYIDYDNFNFRLARNSSCINAGTNMPWMAGAVDLDRCRRLDRFSGLVDMGCYEYVGAGTMISLK